MSKKWYVIHAYSGYEDKVKRNLEQRIRTMDAEDEVFRVEIPTVPELLPMRLPPPRKKSRYRVNNLLTPLLQ